VALLPLVFFAKIFMPVWGVSIFVALILAGKIVAEVFKQRQNIKHEIFSCVVSGIVLCTLFAFSLAYGLLATWLNIVIIVFTCLMLVFRVVGYSWVKPEIVDSIDFCFMMFESTTIFGFVFACFYNIILSISSIAMLFACVCSVTYKIYYMFRYMHLWGRFTSLFKKHTK
ncbi:MAG: hypothetical protein MJ152_04720, partial [Clostridia bacterium]|nr:hypothetical protein [Clostridia bacterium]